MPRSLSWQVRLMMKERESGSHFLCACEDVMFNAYAVVYIASSLLKTRGSRASSPKTTT